MNPSSSESPEGFESTHQYLGALAIRFHSLAEQVADSIVGPLENGLPPDSATINQCHKAVEEYKAAAELVGVSMGSSIPVMIATLQDRMAAGRWEQFQTATATLLSAITRLTHISGQLPPPLVEARKRAVKLLEQLHNAPTNTNPTDWEGRVMPFRALWDLLTEPETLTDFAAELALTQVEGEFGRAIVSALVTRKVVVSIAPAVPSVDEPSHVVMAAFSAITEPETSGDATISQKSSLGDSSLQLPALLSDKVDSRPNLEAFSSDLEKQGPPDLHSLPHAQREIYIVPSLTGQRIRTTAAKETTIGVVEEPIPAFRPTMSTELSTETSGASIRNTIWELLEVDRCGLAYHISQCGLELGLTDIIDPPDLFRAAALAPFVRSSFGEVVDEFRHCITGLEQLAGSSFAADDETTIARRLVLFGLSLRPTLLAPASGATSILQALHLLDIIYPAMGKVRKAIAGFGAVNIELSPSVLKGVRDHACWEQELSSIIERARAWVSSNRQSKIIFAATTNVWHKWLRDDEPLGLPLQVVVSDRRADIDLARAAAHEWSDPKKVEKALHATDIEIRGNGARRKPIEARARGEVCDRVQEFVKLVATWIRHVDSEPQALDDYRQKRADEVREEVVGALTSALAEAEQSTANSAILRAAARFAERSLRDLKCLFDPTHNEVAETPPVRVLLSEELLSIVGLDLDENWIPQGVADAERMRKLLAMRPVLFNAENAFHIQKEARDHVRTAQVIDALHSRGFPQDVVDRLREDRGEHLRLCRKDLQSQLSTTRTQIEQAVCHDLIGCDDRGRYANSVEAYEAGLEDVLNFGRAVADLHRIDAELAERRDARVSLVSAKLAEVAKDELLLNRHDDMNVIRKALDRGDFLSAEEYLELVRSGQSLARVVEARHTVLAEFFTGVGGDSGFVRRFDEFMNGEGRPRDVIDKVRRGGKIGPIDMKGVAEPQAKVAAVMIEAWIGLKDAREQCNRVQKGLLDLLTGFGFADVVVDSVARTKAPHWLAVCRTAALSNPADCIVPQYGSLARGKYRVFGVYDRPNEDALVELTKEQPGTEPLIVLYFGRMTEQRRRDLAEFCRARGRGFLTIDESLVYFLCGERFSRLSVLFQCALPFTIAKPYTTTASLVPAEMFFGRQQEREQVTAIDGTNLVYGGRQLGKSALLRDIERRMHNQEAGQVVRWIDLKNRGIGIDRPTEDIWSEIGQELYRHGVLASPSTTHKTVADRVKEWLNSDDSRRILLLLDEADAFFEMDSQAPVKVTRQSYPEVARLKGLMDDTNRRFKVVFAGLHNVQRAARDPNTPLGHLGTPVCIGPLLDNGEWKQARNLIEVPLRHMGYELTPPDLWMRILSYTNYYPSLIQVFCKHLLESLHNKDQTAFNFRECPPYRVTSDQVERVYQSKNLRDEVSHKFELTLGLDPRYRLIALEIALDSLNYSGGRADGVDVAWIRMQALKDWPSGFVQSDRGYELFRTILDEMVGLGILRRAGEDRYALRSPNVLNLLGSREQIESKLLDVMGLPQPQMYDAATFRRSLGGNRWDHSPFTAEQEATLTEPSNGVAVVFASLLSGLERLSEGLRAIPNLSGVHIAERMTQPTQFETWLRSVDEKRAGEQEGVTLAVVLPSSDWTVGWVRQAADILGRKTVSRKRFLRVVFVANPSMGWSLLAEDELQPFAGTEITVRPWHETALRRWVDELEFNDPHRVCEAVRTKLGGWYLLVIEFAKACHQDPQRWSTALDYVCTQWKHNPNWAEYCDIPDKALKVLAVMADYNYPIEPILLEEFAESTSRADVRRTLRWADSFAYIHRADDENGERWTVDPLLRAYLNNGRE